jgi:gliding motility-associated-like protein
MKKSIWLILVVQIFSLAVTAQKKAYPVKWKTSPFDNNVFIENRGQFNGVLPNNQQVLYKAELGKVQAYFTNKGVVYTYGEKPATAGNPKDKEEKKEEDATPVMHYLSATWIDAAKNVTVSAIEKQSYFYAYPSGPSSTITTNVYKKIVYTNIYPGIDAEYVFPDKKQGIKYSLIVHPGADISKIRLAYEGAKSIRKDAQGNIVISSPLGDITDHAPVTYTKADNAGIASRYELNGVEETFTVSQNYDKNKVIVIDPWTTGTSFAGINAAFDLDYDKYGNVYAYGGLVSSATTQLVKISSTGAKLWVFNASAISGSTPDSYGDICTDKNSGTTYIVQGYGSGIALKVNSAGSLVKTFTGGSTVDEFWRCDFDECNHQIVIGAGGTSNPYQAATLDTNLTTLSPVNVEPTSITEAFHDITLLTIDRYSNTCYMASAKNVTDTILANKLIKMPLPSLAPTVYVKPNGYGFNEVGSIPFAGNQGWDNANAMNGAAASPNWVYLYNGDTLKRFNKTTGALITKVGISTTPFQCGGLDVDACDNIYVGSKNTILVYNSSLTLSSTITLPDTVYDVHLGPNNTLLACGMGFVTSMVAPGSKNILTTIVYPTTCSSCNGKATANPGCGVPPFTYSWSNGETNQTDTGLCPGIYTVTVRDASCPPINDTAIVDISGKLGYGASITDSNPSCYKPKGSLTVFPVGGTKPYTYSWTNGETTQHDTGLIPGIYNCTVTDSNGCRYTTSTTLVAPTPPYVSIFPPVDSVCNGASVTFTASGANTYTWSPGTALSCTACPTTVATPTTNTWYYVTGIDTLGCPGKDSAEVVFSPPPTVTISVIPDGCFGTFLEGFGASSYVWKPATGLSGTTGFFTIATDTVAITYTLVGYAHGCSDSATVTVPATSIPTVTLTANKDTICSGDSVKLTAVGHGITGYNWFPSTGLSCSTCAVTYAHPTGTTFYEVFGFDSAGCSAFAAITITVGGISVTSFPGFCGGPTFLEASGGDTTGYIWKPSTGLSCTNCQFPSATPTVTTTYTVYGKSATAACPSADSAVVVVAPSIPPTVSITASKTTICAGDSVSLSGSGKGTLTYEWIPFINLTCFVCQNTIATPSVTTTYVLYGFDSIGCTATDTVTIIVNPKVRVRDSVDVCAGKSYLIASGSTSYTWSPTTGLSCSTCAVTIATPTVPTTYTVTGAGTPCPGGDTASVSVPVLPPLATVSIKAASDTVCAGDSTLLSTTSTGGVVTWSWFPFGGLYCDACANTMVQVNGNISYTVTVTTSGGCKAKDSITLYAATTSTTVKQHYICPGSNVTLTASGGTSYLWSTGALTSSINVAPLATTSYTVLIKQKGGCADTVIHVVNVNPVPVPVVCCGATITAGQSVNLSASGGASYIWSPVAGLSCVSCANPVATPSVTTTYYVLLSSDSGCHSVDSLVIFVKEKCDSAFNVPNVFTPNGDNKDDFFVIDASNMATYSIEIYDRWGKQVFTSSNAGSPWNGKLNNSGPEESDGVYYYIIKATCGSHNFDTHGFVQLIR